MKNLSNRFTLFSLFLVMITFSVTTQAAGPKISLDDANNDLRDVQSLQRGAMLFTNYCMACHSVKYMRYNRIARDLGWTDEEVVKKMSRGLSRPVDYVMTSMSEQVQLAAFGTLVPDLSLTSRVKGTDYIFTFIRGFEQDEEGNWDNAVIKGTSMPNVLAGLKKTSTEEEYDQATRDISNFLEYVGDPSKIKRWDLGWKVMLFLFVLFVLAYLLKREYWRDIKS